VTGVVKGTMQNLLRSHPRRSTAHFGRGDEVEAIAPAGVATIGTGPLIPGLVVLAATHAPGVSRAVGVVTLGSRLLAVAAAAAGPHVGRRVVGGDGDRVAVNVYTV